MTKLLFNKKSGASLTRKKARRSKPLAFILLWAGINVAQAQAQAQAPAPLPQQALTLKSASALLLAQPLPELLQKALADEPSIRELVATQAAAQSKLEASKAQHWPRFGVATVKASGPESNLYTSKPALTASINLFAGGSLQAQVDADQHAVEYWSAKLSEAKDDVAFKVASLYLEVLRAQDSLVVSDINLKRHAKITRDLTTITQYDGGRMSDLLQARARTAQVNARILATQSDLEAARSRLAKYGGSSNVTASISQSGLDLPIASLPAADLAQFPTYAAQQKEVLRAQSLVKVTQGQRYPRLNLESSYNSQLTSRLALSWDFFDRASSSSVDAANNQVLAAQAKLQTVESDFVERSRTARVGLVQSLARQNAARSQLEATQQVAIAYEKQFLIARRSLVDLLNAYADLAAVESSVSQSEQDARAAQLQVVYSNGGLARYLMCAGRNICQ